MISVKYAQKIHHSASAPVARICFAPMSNLRPDEICTHVNAVSSPGPVSQQQPPRTRRVRRSQYRYVRKMQNTSCSAYNNHHQPASHQPPATSRRRHERRLLAAVARCHRGRWKFAHIWGISQICERLCCGYTPADWDCAALIYTRECVGGCVFVYVCTCFCVPCSTHVRCIISYRLAMRRSCGGLSVGSVNVCVCVYRKPSGWMSGSASLE